MQFTSSLENGIDYGSVQFEDVNTQQTIQSLQEFNTGNSIVFFHYATANDFANSVYYCPSYETYSLSYANVNSTSRTMMWALDHHKDQEWDGSDGQTLEIHLNSSTNNIIWMVNVNSEFFKQLQSKIELKSIILPDGNVVYYSIIENNTNFTIDNITFIKD